MVCSTDLHAEVKQSSGSWPQSSEVAGVVLSKVGVGHDPPGGWRERL
ncbi:hypothetical protein AVEN_155466-1, partial [Araneus ventricosus]